MYQGTIISWPRFTVGRLTQTPVKYTISETLKIINCENISKKLKKIKFFRI